jgi:hypothetical protein
MDLVAYAARLSRDLRVVAEPGGEEALVTAERLAAALESSIRLVLLDALVEAAGEISRELAPGSVEVLLRGREVDFAVTASVAADDAMVDVNDATGPAALSDVDEGGGTMARLSLRLPERLKPKVEEAAAAAGLSVNAWLVRSIGALVEAPVRPAAARPASPPPSMTTGQRQTGWVR